MEENSIFDKLQLGLLTLFVFTLPILFVPAFADFYQFPKIIFVTFIAALALILKIVETVVNKQALIQINPAHLPVAILLIAYLLSTFIQDPNYTEALISRTLLIASLSVLFFVSANNLKQYQVQTILYGLIASCTLLALIAIAHMIGVTEKISSAAWLNNNLWNPTGSPVTLATLLLIGTISSVTLALKQQIFTKSLLLAGSILQTIAFIVVFIELIPGETPTILNLPQHIGYSIAIDTLKNWRTALFGVGPSNFLAAFTFFKPTTYNLDQNLWNVRFLTSSNELFHTMTITGLVGITGLGLLFLYVIKCAISSIRTAPTLAVAAFILLVNLIFFPGNAVTLSLLFVFVILFNSLSVNHKVITSSSPTSTFASVGLLSILAIAFLFYGGKFALADIQYYQSLQALAKGQGKAAYDKQLRAIQTNPRKINYQVSYAQTNLLLANALARQEELTETDKQTILQLIKQSVDASKSAVALNRQNANSWENLAQVYRQLINFADKADDYSKQAYGFELRLDPRNPRIWVDYGGLLITLKDYDNAVQAFRQAVALKPDYANAHYNLAYTYKQIQKNDLAYSELQNVLSLIPKDSADYQQAKKEADELSQILGTQTGTGENTSNPNSAGTSELAAPSPAPEKPEDIDTINLDENDAPENLQDDQNNTLPIPSAIPTTVPAESNNQNITPTPTQTPEATSSAENN